MDIIFNEDHNCLMFLVLLLLVLLLSLIRTLSLMITRSKIGYDLNDCRQWLSRPTSSILRQFQFDSCESRQLANFQGETLICQQNTSFIRKGIMTHIRASRHIFSNCHFEFVIEMFCRRNSSNHFHKARYTIDGTFFAEHFTLS